MVIALQKATPGAEGIRRKSRITETWKLREVPTKLKLVPPGRSCCLPDAGTSELRE